MNPVDEPLDRRDSKETAAVQPVMLALSTFRYSDSAAELALDKAAESGKLFVLYVVDINVSRYLIGTEMGHLPKFEEEYEKQLLDAHRQQSQARLDSIAEKAHARGITMASDLVTGRFGLEAVKAVEVQKPSLVVTVRSKRPRWVKRLFGSPVDYLISHIDCEVIEA